MIRISRSTRPGIVTGIVVGIVVGIAPLALVGLTVPAAAMPVAAAPAPAVAPTEIRVDQLGYRAHQTKYAYLLAGRALSDPVVDVLDRSGRRVTSAEATLRGRWSARYPDVYTVDLSRLRRDGRYHLRLRGTPVVSVDFPVGSAAQLWAPVLRYGVSFDQVQRDGADVITGALDRRPSHLNDAAARTYAWPTFADPDSDAIVDADLTRVDTPLRNVSGGWSDAGDYLKLTHSAAYADVLLYATENEVGRRAPSSLLSEAHVGTDWLMKMWDGKRKVLDLQVGIGSGNEAGTFYGDHDLFRLPDDDDQDTAFVDRYATAHRPVFRANQPGQQLSPNLAGRVSAALAMAARADACRHPRRARTELADATAIYALADTATPPEQLVTALPYAFYPETVWRDDMELGAVELAQADRALHRPFVRYLADAAHWADGYLEHDTGDTFNLYDVSALAHTELVRATRWDRRYHSIDARVVDDLARQLAGAEKHAAGEPFRGGVDDTQFDVDSHTLGLIATAGWYHQLTRSHRFEPLASALQGWVFGANAWGVSFMVGVGTTFPHCMQHQIANINGKLDGTPPLDVGAVVNGPNGADLFSDGIGGFQDGMVHCPGAGASPAVKAGAFDGSGSVYLDDVRSWQTDEPALDMTGAAIMASGTQLH